LKGDGLFASLLSRGTGGSSIISFPSSSYCFGFSVTMISENTSHSMSSLLIVLGSSPPYYSDATPNTSPILRSISNNSSINQTSILSSNSLKILLFAKPDIRTNF